jgi:crotonobetainyl-CoA:carnitine CoA-transferase CaiB-like acyl-CoA transferase
VTLPLEGLRVLDCSQGVAGPKAAMLLGDFGAEVLKVEPPGGDRARAEPGFATWNRNKRAATIDYCTAEGREALLGLADGADVLVLSDPASHLQRLGLSPAELAARCPALVVLHAPPFGASGEPELPESGQLLSAASGAAREQYSYEGVPVDHVTPHLLYAQAMWAAMAAVAALVERARSGHGQVVTVSGIHATTMMITGTATEHPAINRGVRAGGGTGPIPFFRLYPCRDGEWLILAALTPAFAIKALEVLDVLDILADPRINGEPQAMALPANAGWAIERLGEAFRARTRDEWLALFRGAGLPCGPVSTREEWFASEQVAAIGMRVEVDDPGRGRVAMPGIPMKLSKTPGSVRLAAPALPPADSVLPTWEPRPTPAGAAPASRGPLEGLRVIDLGVVIAGSFGGTLFAELGADVMKVEPRGGDSLRVFAPTWLGYNKNKRSAVIDLQTESGRAAFLELVRTADVVIDNYRPGVLERLRLTYDDLKAVKPDIITVSVTGYGEGGLLSNEPGFDPVLQAASGMMKAQGGDDAPTFLTLPVVDTPTALAGAIGACLALFHRARTGEGQRVTTSLAAASIFGQSGEFTFFEGRPPSLRGGRDFQGPSAFDRFYRTKDGWLRLQARTEAEVDALRAAGYSEDNLAERLAAMEGLVGAEHLRTRGVPAVAAAGRFKEFYDTTPAAREQEAMAGITMADGSTVWAAGRYCAFSRTPLTGHGRPPGLGEHTREILLEAGLAETAIDRLLAEGVAVQGKPLTL